MDCKQNQPGALKARCHRGRGQRPRTEEIRAYQVRANARRRDERVGFGDTLAQGGALTDLRSAPGHRIVPFQGAPLAATPDNLRPFRIFTFAARKTSPLLEMIRDFGLERKHPQ